MLDMYANPGGYEQAPEGLYIYPVGDLDGQGFVLGRHWGLWGQNGNTGIRYDDEAVESGTLLRNWRTTAWASNPNTNYQNQGSGSPGKFTCNPWTDISLTLGRP